MCTPLWWRTELVGAWVGRMGAGAATRADISNISHVARALVRAASRLSRRLFVWRIIRGKASRRVSMRHARVRALRHFAFLGLAFSTTCISSFLGLVKRHKTRPSESNETIAGTLTDVSIQPAGNATSLY